MQRIVFYGKGGIGKSTNSTNVSATMAAMGLRVLHVGCDPKHDSTVALMDGEMIPAVTDLEFHGDTIPAESVVTRSRLGIDCVEAGGPHAGVGCAGRGVSRMLEIFGRSGLLEPGRYDVALFDVLGDVVCGGFAAPLRKEMGEKVVIVASEEVMALYAANNIAKAVVNYASNGIVLAGIVLNVRDMREDLEPARRFARLVNTRILGVIPRDPLVREAEYRKCTAVELFPDSEIAAAYRALTEKILAIEKSACPLPTPLSDEQFYAYTRRKFAEDGPDVAPDATPVRVAAKFQPRHAPELSPPRPSAPSGPDFDRELKAGVLAVRMGKVRAEVAASRLREAFPDQARDLTPADLMG